jgi:ADP-ribose pyrophosphatase YjhB (NUDIX family)
MEDHKIHVRVRLVIIKNGKLLVQYRQKQNYFHYVGGHLEFGETILEAALREISEECDGATFTFNKILYVRDFIALEDNQHSVEFFILGDINKFEELEKLKDPQHLDGSVWCTWLDINNLPDNLYPTDLSKILLTDYKNNFPNQGKYIGKI